MLALAGYPLDIALHAARPGGRAPAAGRSRRCSSAAYDDPDGARPPGRGVDVVTYEFENVPARRPTLLAPAVAVHPPPAALAVAQDRLAEKTLFQELGIRTAGVRGRSTTQADLDAALGEVGLPAVLKTRRLATTARGSSSLRDARPTSARACAALGGLPLIARELVPFDRELSVLAVRGRGGEVRTYPLVENHHRDGILRLTLAPAPAIDDRRCRSRPRRYARLLLERLDYVGVLAVELFAVGGRLLANEIAPRVHNSGHWTIEGAETSQFENHLRAVLGLPLGATAARSAAARWST